MNEECTLHRKEMRLGSLHLWIVCTMNFPQGYFIGEHVVCFSAISNGTKVLIMIPVTPGIVAMFFFVMSSHGMKSLPLHMTAD